MLKTDFGETGTDVWVGFDAIFAADELPQIARISAFPIVIAPDHSGDIHCYNAQTQTWTNITPANFDKTQWHRYAAHINYAYNVPDNMGRVEIYLDSAETPLITYTFTVLNGSRSLKKFFIKSSRDISATANAKQTYIDNIYAASSRLTGLEFPANPPAARIPAVDTDSDGMDDNWELKHFGDLATANASSDFNGDGKSDCAHFFDYEIPVENASVNLQIFTPLEK